MTMYHDYLQSADWAKRRQWVLEFWDHRCALCFSTEKLEVHHRTYQRLGQEKLTDLIVLCDACHEQFHEKLGRTGQVTIGKMLFTVIDKMAERAGA